MVIKTSDSQRENSTCEGQKIQLRKNCSLMKRDLSSYLRMGSNEKDLPVRKGTISRLNPDYTNSDELETKTAALYKAKTEKVFE
jgi:hypothetical protein